MPRFIVAAKRKGTMYFFEYSTIVDAAVSPALPEKEFLEYYTERYHDNLEARMQRVRKKGTSSMRHKTAKETVAGNRAGLSLKRLLKQLSKETSQI